MKITIEIDAKELELMFGLNNTDVKKEPEDCNDYHISEYARFFDRENLKWKDDYMFNLAFLRSVQNHCNDVLRSKGKLYLNYVYEQLGFPKTKTGEIVGWRYSSFNHIGDNYVDFNIYSTHNIDYINCSKNSCLLLDFNVDGII